MPTKVVYLTVDDAPSPVLDRKTDFLKAHNIPAVFFCLGSLLEKRSELAVNAVRKGFVLGNHSYDHPHFSSLTLAQCREQIERTDALLERVYQEAAVKRPAKYFRFPYGDKGGFQSADVIEPYKGEGAVRKEALQHFLRDLGYTQPRFENITYAYACEAGILDDVDWRWTYDVMDWSVYGEEPMFGIDRPEKLFERIEEDVPEKGRGLNYLGSEDIVLMHDIPEAEAVFEQLIERMLEKGIAFRSPG